MDTKTLRGWLQPASRLAIATSLRGGHGAPRSNRTNSRTRIFAPVKLNWGAIHQSARPSLVLRWGEKQGRVGVLVEIMEIDFPRIVSHDRYAPRKAFDFWARR